MLRGITILHAVNEYRNVMAEGIIGQPIIDAIMFSHSAFMEAII
ncbi:MAG: hypothetical protein MPEBLZ_01677 [Candidatus Methanoperedens nitroreducens]|uniref:Uncharacterized protein n=1 Tax=Candidatus Methanoperedens nitratireducens TaxID=1392998 RepID=A0A0P8E0U1_9EURY|nr:MAG: hypothetical protein MPEBLZ_01677 [Candidatus Methanoperedens sp. BLZ1]